MSEQTAILLFIFIVATITGIARRVGASRWLAFSIPVAPMIAWLAYCLISGAAAVGEGGAVGLWLPVGVLLLVSIPISAITVFIVPKRHGKPST
ncbi:MAG TPA: hypothetical protein VNX46_02220 [Candidatus Acidoferrum sp.]|nr:hypothetical protein [Candidatus Acidoferrum sp.]